MHDKDTKSRIMLSLKIAEYLEIKKPVLRDDHSLELKSDKGELTTTQEKRDEN